MRDRGTVLYVTPLAKPVATIRALLRRCRQALVNSLATIYRVLQRVPSITVAFDAVCHQSRECQPLRASPRSRGKRQEDACPRGRKKTCHKPSHLTEDVTSPVRTVPPDARFNHHVPHASNTLNPPARLIHPLSCCS